MLEQLEQVPKLDWAVAALACILSGIGGYCLCKWLLADDAFIKQKRKERKERAAHFYGEPISSKVYSSIETEKEEYDKEFWDSLLKCLKSAIPSPNELRQKALDLEAEFEASYEASLELKPPSVELEPSSKTEESKSSETGETS